MSQEREKEETAHESARKGSGVSLGETVTGEGKNIKSTFSEHMEM